MTTPVLATNRLVAGYHGGQVLHGVSLELHPQEVVAVLGPNGAGKTTLLRTVAGLLHASSGSVMLRGVDITRRSAHERSRLRVAYVPEERSAFAPLTVSENLRLGALPAGRAATRDWIEGRLAIVHGLFPRLEERASQEAGTLSGGEQKMLVIGRALMAAPDVLLLDEPSQGLAPQVVDQILTALQEAQRSESLSVLVVEQNVDRVMTWASRAYVLANGRVCFAGDMADLSSDMELVGRLYMGDVIETA